MAFWLQLVIGGPLGDGESRDEKVEGRRGMEEWERMRKSMYSLGDTERAGGEYINIVWGRGVDR